MKLLIDTNIVLEVLLAQERAEEAKALLVKSDEVELFITDFSLHSIGLLLFRQKKYLVFQQFIDDMLILAGLEVVRLPVEDMKELAGEAQKFNFDFDDAYQYTAARKYGLEIISFDIDFDRTEIGRKTPGDVINV